MPSSGNGHRPTIVTGATGFAGGHLLDRLRGRANLVGWRRPNGRDPREDHDTDWDFVDLADGDNVLEAIARRKPREIYHLAGAANVATSWTQVARHLRTNALGVHHILEAVRKTGEPCRVLVVTSAQVYHSSDEPLGEDAPLAPSTPYGISKLAEDQLALRVAEDDGLDVVVARPFNHVGPRQTAAYAVSSFARQIARIETGLESAELYVGNLDARRDITDVRDVVVAYEQLMAGGRSGTAYNVCSGRSWRIGDLLEELLNLSSTPIRVEMKTSNLRPSDVSIVQGNASLIRAELGWQPKIRVETTLADTLNWWRANLDV